MKGPSHGALYFILALVLLALVAPWLSPYGHDFIDWRHQAVPPQLEASHWLGTDRLGRDLFARGMQALRVSLLIGLVSALVSVCIGVAWGAVAGYVGGRLDALMMRFVDIVYALPYVFIVIILSTLLPRGSLAALFLAIGAVGWLTMARIVRGQTLSLRRREFVQAAIASGVRVPGILWRHIVPNVTGTVIAYATLTIPQVILFESFLSFLGVGVQPPTATWGGMVADGRNYVDLAWWIVVFPGLAITLFVLGANFLGDALQDMLDPKAR